MLYVEDIAALKFWLSTARVALDGQTLARLSALDGCPATARESAWHSLDEAPYSFERPTLAVPEPRLRVQRKRFDYHVWTRPIPPGSFVRITHDLAVASPALAIAQVSQSLHEEHLAQAICSLAGTYMTPPGKRAGMIDELEPLVTIEELLIMAEELKGMYSTRRLRAVLKYVAGGSASPGETKLLLACAMPKTRGGLFVQGWQMNLELEVPYKLQRYLGQSKIKPDLLLAEHDLILEYDSDERHSDQPQKAKDEKRRVVFELMGYKPIPVYTPHMGSAYAFEAVATEVLGIVGRKRINSTPQQLAARETLLKSLSNNPLLY